MDDELEAIKKQKLKELEQEQAAFEQQELNEQMLRAQQKEMDTQKKAILRQVLTQKARERLGTLRLAHPELVDSLEHQLIRAAQSLDRQIDDATLKMLLRKMIPQKKERKIIRR